MVWLCLAAGELIDVYLYILLEFQSQQDPWTAVWVAAYTFLRQFHCHILYSRSRLIFIVLLCKIFKVTNFRPIFHFGIEIVTHGYGSVQIVA